MHMRTLRSDGSQQEEEGRDGRGYSCQDWEQEIQGMLSTPTRIRASSHDIWKLNLDSGHKSMASSQERAEACQR